jgi:hypothetical protein
VLYPRGKDLPVPVVEEATKYCKGDRIKEDEIGRTGEKRNTCKILVPDSESRRSPGRPRRRWMDDIKMNIWE